MCIIVDTNVLSEVFDSSNQNHMDFKPVYEWIMHGKGKLVFGGSKYAKELGKYLPLFVQLKKVNKAVYLEDEIVDTEQQFLSGVISHSNFDDQHLVALLKLSGCKLICSNDRRAYPYFTHSKFFSKNNRPKIYSSKRNIKLLTDLYIADCCKPCKKISTKLLVDLSIFNSD